jgi:integrase
VLVELDPERRRARIMAEKNVDVAELQHMTDYRDHLRLAAATAWHVTELARFASAGRVLEATQLQRADGSDLVLETVHKNGEVFRTRVGGDASVAARRIHAAGGFSIERYAEAVAEAARAAGIETNFRGALRHSALTWVSELEGEEAAQKVARHKSPRTTKKNYAERAAPPNPLTRMRLVK